MRWVCPQLGLHLEDYVLPRYGYCYSDFNLGIYSLISLLSKALPQRLLGDGGHESQGALLQEVHKQLAYHRVHAFVSVAVFLLYRVLFLSSNR